MDTFEQTPGSQNDVATMAATNMQAVSNLMAVNGVLYCSFGDGGFVQVFPHLRRMWRPPLALPQALSNASMTRVRSVAIEVFFAMMVNTWQGINFAAQNKPFVNKPDLNYRVAVLLLNMRSCLENDNLIVDYFRRHMFARAVIAANAGGPPAPANHRVYLPLPSLAEYCAGIW
jgi:hypothetical protein